MPSIEVYNANVVGLLGGEPLAEKDEMAAGLILEKKVGQKIILQRSTLPLRYGIELEFEIDKNGQLVKELIDSTLKKDKLSAHQKKVLVDSLFKQDANKNTQVAYKVSSYLYPFVKDFCIIKRDGSLKNGLEIVSRPMMKDFHYKKWEEFFNAIKFAGLVIRKSCGMHVHVSRELLTPLQIGKIIAFLHNPENYSLVKLIAGRTPSKEYSNIDGRRKVSDVKTYAQKGNGKHHDARYNALNIKGTSTIEFRIFKGVSSLTRMLSNLDFCAAIINWSWPGNSSVREIDATSFLKYVSDNRKEHPYLYSFLVSKKVLVDEKERINTAKKKKKSKDKGSLNLVFIKKRNPAKANKIGDKEKRKKRS